MPEQRKKLKDTKFGLFLKEKAPKVLKGILDVADDYFPPAKMLTQLLANDPEIPPAEKQEILQKFQELELEYEKIRLADVANAREREIQITKATGKRDIVLMVLAFFGVLAPVIIVGYLMIWGMPKMSADIAMLVGGLIGMIVGEYKTVFGYFFGSSAGSKEKTQTINAMMEEG